MPRVRQLPIVYLRGSIANVTMRGLTTEQRNEVERLTVEISNHPVLSGHRHMFMHQLGRTIGCDYASDRTNARQDYDIAIWRAVVHLLHHSGYSFICSGCTQTGYQSKTGQRIAFNRCYSVCPNCEQIKIEKPGDSSYIAGDIVSHVDYLTTRNHLATQNMELPTCSSPIESLSNDKKVADPQKILNDPAQIKKFFGMFIWNYFRQIIRENSITTHGKQQDAQVDVADQLLAKAIVGVLKEYGLEHSYVVEDNPRDGHYRIYCNPLALPLIASVKILALVAKVQNSAPVRFSFDDQGLLISDLQGQAPLIQLDVACNDAVFLVGNTAESSKHEDSPDVISQISGGDMQDDGINQIEANDRLSKIRSQLPHGRTREIFDLMSGVGDSYSRFIDKYPDGYNRTNGIPRKSKMAEFLNCSAKDIKAHSVVIRHAMLAVYS